MRFLYGLALTFAMQSALVPSAGQAASSSIPLATYTLAAIAPDPSGVALLDLRGTPLGPRLDDGAFCDLAAAGAGVIDRTTFRVVGTAPKAQVFCGRYYSRLQRKQPVAAGALGRSRFERVTWQGRDWPHGIGARAWRLVPGRTAANGPGGAAHGSALHVAALVGVVLPDDTLHDGDVLVVDTREDVAAGAAALYLGIAGREWRIDPTVPLVATLITDRSRAARLGQALRTR